MTALGECEPLHLPYAGEVRSKDTVLGLVVVTVEQKRRDLNLVNVFENRPRLQRPRDMELGRSIPTRHLLAQVHDKRGGKGADMVI